MTQKKRRLKLKFGVLDVWERLLIAVGYGY